jgi:hypothetical protein
METRADLFASAKPMLFSIAYRMLGSVMDAEDLGFRRPMYAVGNPDKLRSLPGSS